MLPSLLCLDPQRKLCLEERRFGHSAGRLGNRPRRGAAGSLIASGTILQVDTGVSRPKGSWASVEFEAARIHPVACTTSCA